MHCKHCTDGGCRLFVSLCFVLWCMWFVLNWACKFSFMFCHCFLIYMEILSNLYDSQVYMEMYVHDSVLCENFRTLELDSTISSSLLMIIKLCFLWYDNIMISTWPSMLNGWDCGLRCLVLIQYTMWCQHNDIDILYLDKYTPTWYLWRMCRR